MIKINLLSPDDKDNIKWEKINGFVRANLFLIAFMQLIVIGFFVGAVVYVDIENRDMEKKLEEIKLRPEIAELQLIEIDIKKYNKQSRAILAMQEDQVYWTRVLNHLSQITAAEIKIDSINIEPSIAKDDSGSVNRKIVMIDPNVFDVVINGSYVDGNSFKYIFENNLNKSEIFKGFESKPENYDTDIFKHKLFIKRESILRIN